MTREEAVDNLKCLLECNYVDSFEDAENEALDMAIQALEQEPCDDAISRQAVLEIFGYVMDYWEEHAIDVEPHEIEDALIEQYEFTAKILSELPPVTPEPKTGHWIESKDIDFYKCSECECHWEKGMVENCNMDYCPNCGARMVEPQESEG